MKHIIEKLLIVLNFSIIFSVFLSTPISAAEFKVISIQKDEPIGDIVVHSNSIIEADNGIIIPKLIVQDGAEEVEINAVVDTLVVVANNKVKALGKGNINQLKITTEEEVFLGTTGDIGKIEITNERAILTITSGTKIQKLILPSNSKKENIISNDEQVKDRFKNIIGGKMDEPNFEFDPEPTQPDGNTPPPVDNNGGSDFIFEGVEGSSTLSLELVEQQISEVGIIPSGVSNIFIELFSTEDVDLEIWDVDNDIPVLAYGNLDSVQADSETQVSWNYQGLEFVYSGWTGVDGILGNEWIIIKGTTDRNYKIQVQNLGADTTATVNYSWGNEEEDLSAIEEDSIVSEDED